jgi:hypothetical protein
VRSGRTARRQTTIKHTASHTYANTAPSGKMSSFVGHFCATQPTAAAVINTIRVERNLMVPCTGINKCQVSSRQLGGRSSVQCANPESRIQSSIGGSFGTGTNQASTQILVSRHMLPYVPLYYSGALCCCQNTGKISQAAVTVPSITFLLAYRC